MLSVSEGLIAANGFVFRFVRLLSLGAVLLVALLFV